MGKGACGTCHFVPLFNGVQPPELRFGEPEIIGVTETADFTRPTLDPDPGRFLSDPIVINRFAFKVSTLRNVALTAPYMHNGAFTTLEEVVDFYDRGGGAGLGLDVPGQTLPPDSLGLTATERAALVAFMRALTDTSVVRAAR
jgi:cytochrome c peroxidase